MDNLPGFLLAGLALVGSPGPATLRIAAAGAAFGRRRGLACMAGVLAGLAVVRAATASGVGAALTRHFRDLRRNRAINIAFAALLVPSVAATLLI